MFICYKCLETKECLESEKTLLIDGYSEYATIWEHHCGGEFVEAVRCPLCQKWQASDEFDTICDDCFDIHLNVENCVDFVESENLQKEYFVDFWTNSKTKGDASDYLIEMCKKDWRNRLRHNRSIFSAIHSIKTFVKTEASAFKEFILEVIENEKK